jgi:hypothetical protein
MNNPAAKISIAFQDSVLDDLTATAIPAARHSRRAAGMAVVRGAKGAVQA